MALLPQFFLDCVVAIEKEDYDGRRALSASGFLYGVRMAEGDEAGYRVFLITNRHVLDGLAEVHLRLNPHQNKSAQELPLPLLDETQTPTWTAHPDRGVDVAAVPINFALLQRSDLQVSFFENDKAAITVERMRQLGVCEGDFAYVLGFPLGLGGGHRNAVVVRSGIVARLRDLLDGQNDQFLLDAFVFPGNSGGPVVLKPEVMAIEGTDAPSSAYLIGVVRSYVPYQDVAVSQQSGRPRVIFEENSGLAAIHPVDAIEATVRAHLARAGGAERAE